MHYRNAVTIAAFILAFGAVSNDRADALGAPICFDASSPSASIDRQVARAAVRVMHAGASVEPYDGSSGVSERYFRFLARSHCALIMGFPVDSVNPDPPGGLALTHIYLRTGYVIASLGRPRPLASIPGGASVAVGMATVPNFYLVGALGPASKLAADVYQTQEQALAALVARRVPVAMVWAPSVVQYVAAHPGIPHILMTPLPIPHAQWGVAALYAETNTAFAKRFNAALTTLRSNGTLSRLTTSAGLEAK